MFHGRASEREAIAALLYGARESRSGVLVLRARLFVSPRTIDAHLRSVYAKPGISSRTQLARLELPGLGAGLVPALA